MFSVMRTSATVSRAPASRRVRSFVSPSGSPITNGARVVRARWPAPRFVAPHSTVPTTRLPSPTMEAMRSCTSPFPRETNACARPRSTSGPRAVSRCGAFRVTRASRKVPEDRQGRRGRRGGRGSPRPDPRGGGRGRAASRRAPRWRRGRSRAARRPPSSRPSRRRWRRPRLPGRSLRSWGRPRIDGWQLFQELVQRGVAPVALQEQTLPLFIRVPEKSRPALGARAPLFDEVSERLGGLEPFAEAVFEDVEHVHVHVEAGHVCDLERAEERQPEAEATTHDLIHLLRRGEPLLHAADRLQKKRVLDAVGHEARPVADDGRTLPDGAQKLDQPAHDLLLGRGGGYNLDTGRPLRW